MGVVGVCVCARLCAEREGGCGGGRESACRVSRLSFSLRVALALRALTLALRFCALRKRACAGEGGRGQKPP